MKMLRLLKSVPEVNNRSFKNFGHKRQKIPAFTTVWHAFLTFTFIGMGIEWKRIAKFIFGEDIKEGQGLWDPEESNIENQYVAHMGSKEGKGSL